MKTKIFIVTWDKSSICINSSCLKSYFWLQYWQTEMFIKRSMILRQFLNRLPHELEIMWCHLIVSCVVSSAVYRQRHLWCIWNTKPLYYLPAASASPTVAESQSQLASTKHQRKFPICKLSIPNCLAHH